MQTLFCLDRGTRCICVNRNLCTHFSAVAFPLLLGNVSFLGLPGIVCFAGYLFFFSAGVNKTEAVYEFSTVLPIVIAATIFID